jgi:hypothetical protein
MPLLTVAAALLFALLAYLLLFRPTLGRMVPGGDLDLTGLRDRKLAAEQYRGRLDVAASAFAQVNAERKAVVTNAVPTKIDIPGLYVTLDEIAKRHGMLLTTVDVVPDDKAVSQAGRRPIRITANFDGATYQQFKVFLTDLERSERLLDLSSVLFTPGSGSYDLAMRGYWIDPARPAAPPEPDAAATAPAPAQ